MDLDQGIELLILLCCLFAFLFYYFYLFIGRSILRRWRKQRPSAKTAFIFSNAQEARQVWVQVITRDKTDAGVPAVQTLRNSIMAASFMATTCGLMAVSGVLPVLTDPTKIAWLVTVADTDPIVSNAGSRGVISTQWKLASTEFMLLMSFLFFLQAIRLWSFLGYYIRVTPADEENRFPMDVTLAVSRRAGHCWSAGVRCFILIIPLILWLMGPTSLLVTSVVLLLFLVSTDFVRVHNTTHAAGDVEELQELQASKTSETKSKGQAGTVGNASHRGSSNATNIGAV